jgi:predicted phosphodiesterase
MNDYCSIYYPNEPPKTVSEKVNWKPVRKFTINDMSRLHIRAVRYIVGALKKVKPDEVAILLTHHKPIRDKPKTDLLSQAYESDLLNIIVKKPLKFCGFGHTHVKYDKIINGIRIVSNPKGYTNQQTHFNPACVVII